MAEMTKAELKAKIETLLMEETDRGMHAVGRALPALYDRQTEDEKAAEAVHHHNGMGFTAYEADIGSSMAVYYKTHNYLTDRQLAYWRAIKGNNKARILKYAGQLAIVAREKEAARKRMELAAQAGVEALTP